ncbi:MAG: TetR/AcrR family transcriptional regulator [Leptolyngbyaceae cyanobacterium MO_188.B28]|nr:TetR/AcrR family transcriptional regulator [Leptolyngbyaceae cyanobacterium MO_188.B28]
MPRVREFDPEEALDKAVDLFWRKGFCDSSMDALVTQTGVSRKGLYSVFGNKRDLFLAALNRYQQTFGREFFAPLMAEGAGLEDLYQFFQMMAQLAASEQGRLGCFVCNTAIDLAPHDAEIQHNVLNYYDWMQRLFSRVLRNAVKRGELSLDFEVDPYARFLVGAFEGIVVLARAGADSSFIDALLKTAVEGLGLTWKGRSTTRDN